MLERSLHEQPGSYKLRHRSGWETERSPPLTFWISPWHNFAHDGVFGESFPRCFRNFSILLTSTSFGLCPPFKCRLAIWLLTVNTSASARGEDAESTGGEWRLRTERSFCVWAKKNLGFGKMRSEAKLILITAGKQRRLEKGNTTNLFHYLKYNQVTLISYRKPV